MTACQGMTATAAAATTRGWDLLNGEGTAPEVPVRTYIDQPASCHLLPRVPIENSQGEKMFLHFKDEQGGGRENEGRKERSKEEKKKKRK